MNQLSRLYSVVFFVIIVGFSISRSIKFQHNIELANKNVQEKILPWNVPVAAPWTNVSATLKQKLEIRNTTPTIIKTKHKTELPASKPKTIQTKTIPKHIHQYWNGPHPPKELMKICKTIHWDWKYTLWTPESIANLSTFHNRKMFDEFARGEINGQSDIVRYSVLREFGGVYLDADTFCLRRLDSFLHFGVFLGYTSKDNQDAQNPENPNIATAVFGAIAQHPLLISLTENLKGKHVQGPAWKQVGPGYMTKIMQSCHTCNSSGDVRVFPFYTFVPYHHSEKKILQQYQNHPQDLPKIKKYRPYAMNLWGSTFNNWQALSHINARKSLEPQTKITEMCKKFPFKWPPGLKQQVVMMLNDTHHMLTKINVEYVAMAGTLLGMFRHQNFIPWDDDLDLYIRYEDTQKVTNAINEHPKYCTAPFWGGIKLFECNAVSTTKYSWKYPFVDIFNYKLTTKEFRKDLDDMFWPAREMYLNNLKLLIPKNPYMYLHSKFGSEWMSSCVSSSWDHRLEKPTDFGKFKTNCTTLQMQCGSNWPREYSIKT